MNKLVKSMIMAAAAAMLTTAGAYADPDQTTLSIFKNLMAATMSNNYDGFVAECDAAMKAVLTKPMLEGVNRQIEPRAKKGYEAQYLGELNQHGYKVHLWRLSFKDGGDDVLATLSIKDGKAGGFYLH
jgi:hypothetical protein